MHTAYAELSVALSQACRALVDQYGAPDSVSSPYGRVRVARHEYWISGPRLELHSKDGIEWQAAGAPVVRASWLPANIEDLQEAERIVAELALTAANGAWLKKANNSIRRLKAILRALQVA